MKHCLPVPPTPAARARSATLAFALALLAGTAHAQAHGTRTDHRDLLVRSAWMRAGGWNESLRASAQ